MRESIFSVEAVRREQEQADLQKKAGLNVEEVSKSARKVTMNITLSSEHKKKLQEYARKKHISASILIQMWIDDNCV